MSKYEKDKIVTGYVTGIEPYGIFVSLDDHYDGLIHISEISNNYVRNVFDFVTIGEMIKMRVIEVNEKNHHVKLSIKDMEYRDNNNHKIIETYHGFKTLESKVPIWINVKIAELDKKK